MIRRTPFAILLPALLLVAPVALAESTRTLRLEYTPSGKFAVENLAGTMRVIPGDAGAVVVAVTVHAEDDEAAALMGLEQVTGADGLPTLRVTYPTDRYRTFHYPGGEEETSWLSSWFGGFDVRTEYAGDRVKVSGSGGLLLYADVEVQLPRRAVSAALRNLVGVLRGERVEGELLFDTKSGDVLLEGLRGLITADTGSGDIKAEDLDGSFTGDTGSGDVFLTGFRGDRILCDTGSGDVRISEAVSVSITADTGSGDVHAEEVDTEEFVADTGSGDVTLVSSSARLARITADTGSGDVRLRLAPDASFEAKADTGSGDIVSRYRDAEPIRRRSEVLGYRRGDARVRIDVETGSGDVVIEPAS